MLVMDASEPERTASSSRRSLMLRVMLGGSDSTQSAKAAVTAGREIQSAHRMVSSLSDKALPTMRKLCRALRLLAPWDKGGQASGREVELHRAHGCSCGGGSGCAC